MPEVYNDEACVAELHTRAIIAGAVNDGWSPAAHGCIPATPGARLTTSSSSSSLRVVLAVASVRSSKTHIVDKPPWTACRRFRCGHPDEDNENIKFMAIADVAEDAEWCKTCETRIMNAR